MPRKIAPKPEPKKRGLRVLRLKSAPPAIKKLGPMAQAITDGMKARSFLGGA